jgi:hypothetical protein
METMLEFAPSSSELRGRGACLRSKAEVSEGALTVILLSWSTSKEAYLLTW